MDGEPKPASSGLRNSIYVRFPEDVVSQVICYNPELPIVRADDDTESDTDDGEFVPASAYRPDPDGFRSTKYTEHSVGPTEYAVNLIDSFDLPELKYSLNLSEICPEELSDPGDRLLSDVSSMLDTEVGRASKRSEVEDEKVYFVGLDSSGASPGRNASSARSLEISNQVGHHNLRFFRHTCGPACQCPDSTKRVGCNQVSTKKRPITPRNRNDSKGKRRKTGEKDDNDGGL